MLAKLGNDAEEAMKALQKNGIARGAAKEALKIAEEQGAFTIFALVDALTRMSQRVRYAGDRLESDQRTAKLLSLVV